MAKDEQKPKMCVECEDTEANVSCGDCHDNYCELCFQAQHRRGTRASHKVRKLVDPSNPTSSDSIPPVPTTLTASMTSTPSVATAQEHQTDIETQEEEDEEQDEAVASARYKRNASRSKYIPMRLSQHERSLLVLLDSALSVSEYTDNVDILSYRSSGRRILHELAEIFSLMSGLTIATNFHKGKKIVGHRNFQENADFLQQVFEIGRRYKIMNPEKMRDNYGKLIYLLQDATTPQVQKALKFSCIRPIQTVYSHLEHCKALAILEEHDFDVATAAITTATATASLQEQSQAKQQAIQRLCGKYSNDTVSTDEIKLVLASFADNNAYLALNSGPIDKMLEYLETYFHPEVVKDSRYSLAISSGRNGARLTHSHSKQYAYAHQSLELWNSITKEMFRLWSVAEDDLLYGSSYRLRDTGQGLNRVQRAPQTSKLVHAILRHTQSASAGHWVGSTVIHLGDRDVPNALMFIDKYTQISRILSPLVQTVEEIHVLARSSEGLNNYIANSFGSVEDLRLVILSDFFKHAFDGSGADNFFDAGSCIDGRLTSAWNWCSLIEKKSYYHVFKLAGFIGFDGHFEN